MFIRWLDDRTGLNLKPIWEIESALVHTIKRRDNNERHEYVFVQLLVIRLSVEQMTKLVKDYGKDNVPLGMLGIPIFELIPDQPLWIWKPPAGYEDRIKVATYHAFELVGSLSEGG